MPVLSRRHFSEMSQVKIGLVGVMALTLLIAVALQAGKIKTYVLSAGYHAEFAQGAGLRSGADVMVSGLKVGTVTKVRLEGQHVLVEFGVSDVRLGDKTTADIKTANAVGTRYLSLNPAGAGNVSTIRLDHTSVPYDLSSALGDLTATTAALNVDQVAESMNSLSQAFATTPGPLRGAMSGVRRISETLASRDEALGALLKRASSVSGVVAERSDQIVKLIADSSLLFQELTQRRQVIQQLLVGVQDVSTQLSGLVKDNEKQFGPALTELNKAVALLRRNDYALGYILSHLGGFARNLGEAVGGGPFFYGYVQNIFPSETLPLLPDLVHGSAANPR